MLDSLRCAALGPAPGASPRAFTTFPGKITSDVSGHGSNWGRTEGWALCFGSSSMIEGKITVPGAQEAWE